MTDKEKLWDKWLNTHYAPYKAKSKQKAISTFERFVVFLLDKEPVGSPSKEILNDLSGRLRRWGKILQSQEKAGENYKFEEFQE